jgi:hypothetical protein
MIFFSIAHQMGPQAFGIGDILLHTPIINWFRMKTGIPVDVGIYPQFEWIFRRNRDIGNIETIRSVRQAEKIAGNRLFVLSDHSVDEYGFYGDGLTYTNLLASRIGIPLENEELNKLVYEPLNEDEILARQIIDQLGISNMPFIVANIFGKTRKHNPGLNMNEYLIFLEDLSEKFHLKVLVGDCLFESTSNLFSIQVGLPEWMALIKQSTFWLGECTGPYHFAVALDKPTVMFSSALNDGPWLAEKYSKRNHFVLNNQSGDEIYEKISVFIKSI